MDFHVFELEYFSAVFVTLLHPKLLPSVKNFLPEGFCDFMLWITCLWNHIMASTHGQSDFHCIRNSVDGFILELCHAATFKHFVLHFQSWLQPAYWTFNFPDQEELHYCGVQAIKARLATFLERIWNRYYLDFFYSMKGGTFSTSDPVTLQSVTLIKAKSDFPIERAVNQREVELRRASRLSNDLTMPLDFCTRMPDPKLNNELHTFA